MAENKLDEMIRDLQEAPIDEDGVTVRYFPYKDDISVLINALNFYKASTEDNKMKAVAQLFGKKLGEEFVIQDTYRYQVTAKFSEEGILVYHVVGREWLNNHYWLNELLTGEAVIVDD